MSQKCHEMCKTRSKRGKDGKIKSPIVFLLVLLFEFLSGHKLKAVHVSKISLWKASEWTTLIRIIKGLSFPGGGGGVLPYISYLSNRKRFPCLHSLIYYIPTPLVFKTREGLGEFETVMQTRDELEGLHNRREFSQRLECLYQAMQTQEKSFLLLL